jgi:adenylate cyclase
MDRIWQWAWDRHGARYAWVAYALAFPLLLPVYLFWSFLIVAMERSTHYVEAAAITSSAVLVLAYVIMLPGVGRFRLAEQWAVGQEVDRAKAVDATYAFTRGVVVRAVAFNTVWLAVLSVVVGSIVGADGLRLIQYGILGAIAGTAIQVGAVHSFGEVAVRPARVAIAGATGIGDSMPRSRPTFAAWSTVSMLAAVFLFAIEGAMLATVFDEVRAAPVLFVVIAAALTLAFGLPSVGVAFAPSLRPIRDLAEGTERVAAGDYSQRLPVVQDDDRGALAASFNRMQAGLAERQRLQTAFGT